MNRYLQVLRSQKHPIKFITGKLLFQSRLSTLFKIRRENYILRFYPSSLACELWINSKARQSGEKFFQNYLNYGDRVIDVGANIGTLTIEAAIKVGNSGKVFSHVTQKTPHPHLPSPSLEVISAGPRRSPVQ